MWRFETFYNNWLDCSPILNTTLGVNLVKLPVTLPINFFKNLRVDRNSIQEYRIDAARLCAERLGDNPALCFSGGVDSQAMLQSWMEAGIPFKLYTLKFEDDLNIQDLYHARYIANLLNVELNEIPFNVKSFLNRENVDIGEKYKSISPHFNVHYKMFDILKSQGHTGVVCGGQAVLCNNDLWGANFTRNPMNFINYSNISQFPVQGSFLSFYPELAWSVSLLTKKSNSDLLQSVYQDVELYEKTRYGLKVNGYIRAGFKIIPQSRKFTGFELVKKHYELQTGDTWTFEKKFRAPLSQHLKIDYAQTEFDLTDTQKSELDAIYCFNMSSSYLACKTEEIRKSYFVNYSDVYNMRPW